MDIDHHVLAGAFGDIRVLDSHAASTSEIVYALLEAIGLPLTPDVATCLFTGVITDTGSFRFQNVTPNTFHVAAALLNAGAPPAYISENVFENRTFAATKLLGHALSSLHQTPDGRVIWAHITAQDFARSARRTKTRRASSTTCAACAGPRSACCSGRWPTAKSVFPCAPARRSTSPRSPSSSAAGAPHGRRLHPEPAACPKPSHAGRASRRRSSRPARWLRAVGMNGVLNIDKPAGMTSHDVVARVRRLAAQKRVGHAGTLDPDATGVLLVCLGQATRLADLLADEGKDYRAVLALGSDHDDGGRLGGSSRRDRRRPCHGGTTCGNSCPASPA